MTKKTNYRRFVGDSIYDLPDEPTPASDPVCGNVSIDVIIDILNMIR